MTRKEHLDWCKQRALEYVDMNDLQQAFASMISDLGKHPETQGHTGIDLMLGLMMIGKLDTAKEMRECINGFN